MRTACCTQRTPPPLHTRFEVHACTHQRTQPTKTKLFGPSSRSAPRRLSRTQRHIILIAAASSCNFPWNNIQKRELLLMIIQFNPKRHLSTGTKTTAVRGTTNTTIIRRRHTKRCTRTLRLLFPAKVAEGEGFGRREAINLPWVDRNLPPRQLPRSKIRVVYDTLLCGQRRMYGSITAIPRARGNCPDSRLLCLFRQ